MNSVCTKLCLWSRKHVNSIACLGVRGTGKETVVLKNGMAILATITPAANHDSNDTANRVLACIHGHDQILSLQRVQCKVIDLGCVLQSSRHRRRIQNFKVRPSNQRRPIDHILSSDQHRAFVRRCLQWLTDVQGMKDCLLIGSPELGETLQFWHFINTNRTISTCVQPFDQLELCERLPSVKSPGFGKNGMLYPNAREMISASCALVTFNG